MPASTVNESVCYLGWTTAPSQNDAEKRTLAVTARVSRIEIPVCYAKGNRQTPGSMFAGELKKKSCRD